MSTLYRPPAMPTTADSLKDGLARVGLVSMGPDETANKDNGDLNLVFDPQNKVFAYGIKGDPDPWWPLDCIKKVSTLPDLKVAKTPFFGDALKPLTGGIKWKELAQICTAASALASTNIPKSCSDFAASSAQTISNAFTQVSENRGFFTAAAILGASMYAFSQSGKGDTEDATVPPSSFATDTSFKQQGDEVYMLGSCWNESAQIDDPKAYYKVGSTKYMADLAWTINSYTRQDPDWDEGDNSKRGSATENSRFPPRSASSRPTRGSQLSTADQRRTIGRRSGSALAATGHRSPFLRMV